MAELLRANKVTTKFENGVAVATLYKTHEKLGFVRSDDALVAQLGFVMPESVDADPDNGVDAVQVSPSEKLGAFKEFVQTNATHFGYVYDPVDRRADSNKFPSTYQNDNFAEWARVAIEEKIAEVVESTQKHVDSLVKNSQLPAGSTLTYEIGEETISVTESYANGNLKYADAIFPITFIVGSVGTNVDVKVSIISGQLRKPREFNDEYQLTMTGLKTMLTSALVIPEKVVEKAEKDPFDLMKKDELLAVAEEYKIEDTKSMKKAELVEALKAVGYVPVVKEEEVE